MVGTQHSCSAPKCCKADDDLMVSCDRCKRWWHYSCGKFDPSKYDAITPWFCEDDNCRDLVESTQPSGVAQEDFEPHETNDVHDQQRSSEQGETENSIHFLMQAATVAQSAVLERDRELAAMREEMEGLKLKLATVSTPSQHRTSESGPLKCRTPKAMDDNAELIKMIQANHQALLNHLGHQREPTPLPKKQENRPSCAESAYQEGDMASLLTILNRSNVQELPPFSGADKREWPYFEEVFKSTTTEGRLTGKENVSRLRKALKGEAYQLVSDRLKYSSDADSIMDALRAIFGRQDVLVHDLTADLLNLPPLTSKCDPKIRMWAVKLNGFVADIKSLKREEDLNNGYVLTCLVCRLGAGLYQEWTKRKAVNPRANFTDLADFLTEKQIDMPPELSKHVEVADPRKSSKLPKAVGRVLTHQPVVPKVDSAVCVNCGRKHMLSECPEFRGRTVDQRLAYAKDKRICFCCLVPSKHDWRVCRQRKTCGMDGCSAHHHPLLHQPAVSVAGMNSSASPFIPQAQFHSSHVGSDISVMFKIAPVRIYGKDGRFADTYAFLDDGSSLSMVEKDLFDELGLQGNPAELILQWTKGVSRHENSVRTTLSVSNVHSHKRHLLKGVYTVDNWELPCQSIDVEALKRSYSHLRGLPLSSVTDAKPKLLVGLDHAKFLCGRGQRYGKDEEPCAIKTLLGWIVYGKSAPTLNASGLNRAVKPSMHFLFHDAIRSEDELHELVKHHFTTENFGVMAPKTSLESQEVRRAVDIMQRTLKQVDNCYEIGLLWKSDTVKLPDSYPMALSRLIGLERSLKKRPHLLGWKNNHMKELVSKGYARIASKEELQKPWPRVWYAPTFIVENPNKCSPKPRDVADVAAKVNGVSLNTYLLKGPDNLVPLHAGLFKFRERAVAVNADVKEMFHRIRIIEEDQQCQRVLWRDGDSSRSPDVYIMEVMMFGPRCSPTCSQFFKNHHANLFKEECPEAVDGLTKRTYVDDYFNSHNTVEEAVSVTQDAIRICKSMNFELVGVQSNSSEFLRLTSRSHVNPKLVSIDPNSCESIVSKVLGMYWHPSLDYFSYKLSFDCTPEKVLQPNAIITKREMLRTVMRIFDPLGLVSFFIIRGRIILQEVWREGFDWDEPVSRDLRIAWLEFLRELKNIENIRIARSYVAWNPDESRISLVVFVDASEKAFAAVAYLRFERDGNVEVSQVMAKAKVAPVKQLSVPRLELQAAVLGVRLAATVRDSHKIRLDETLFFSDSKTVLAWINSSKFKFPSFVATGDNVADDATRWNDLSLDKAQTRWFTGPDFLQTPKDAWPVTPGKNLVDPVSIEYLESKTVLLHSKDKPVSYNVYDELGARIHARWASSVRVIAFLLRLKDFLLKRPVVKKPFITPDEYLRAENWLFRKIQMDSFPEDILALKSKQVVGATSKIFNFSPFLDEEGTARMSSRAQKAVVSYAARNPAILPKSHPLVDLLITHHHEKNLHMGTATTISDIRERAWIISIRVAVESVRARCNMCKLRKAKPMMPIMGQLPEARLAFHLRPFTHVGVDCFGPMFVKFGRGTVKRYGMIFTCLTFRAVQIELLNDLSMDQCTMALRRFIIIRVVTRYLYSDNGLNFVGTKNQTDKDIKEMEIGLSEYAAKYEGIVWRFIPAYSPWMGGAWERLIQSIKKSVDFALSGMVPCEDVLRNALMEAQGQINRRPLTHVPVNPEDPKPLTPNSMLFGEDDRDTTAPGIFCERDIWSKFHSRRAQHLMNQMVRRWYVEYLPEITRRTKWHKGSKGVSVGDVVIIFEPTEIRTAWELGRVTKTYAGPDNVVWTADVQVSNGSIKKKRAVGRLAVLDLESSTGVSDGPRDVVEPNNVKHP